MISMRASYQLKKSNNQKVSRDSNKKKIKTAKKLQTGNSSKRRRKTKIYTLILLISLSFTLILSMVTIIPKK